MFAGQFGWEELGGQGLGYEWLAELALGFVYDMWMVRTGKRGWIVNRVCLK